MCNNKNNALGKLIRIKRDYSKKGYHTKIGSSVYCCKNLSEKYQNNSPVYFISNKEPKEYFNAIVIAIVDAKTPNEKFITAPIGHIYYEPDIRALLSKINHLPIHTIICRYEKSCGSIIIAKNPTPKILIVKNRNSKTWGFPKGHVEFGENEYQTALREVYEETGLHVRFINGFRETSDYYAYGCAKKRVVFFVSVLEKPINIRLQAEELQSFKWTDFDRAVKLIKFKNNIDILTKAMAFLKKQKLISHSITNFRK